MTNKLRIGLIGAGRMGRYISPFVKEVGAFELAAAADVSEEARAKAVADCGYGASYADYGQMLVREPLDCVLIATPPHLMSECCLAAIAARKHVFVEKPMALNQHEAAAVVAAARAAHVKVIVGYCLRYAAVRTTMKDLLGQGAVGEITAVVVGKGSGPLHTGWHGDPKRGGGQMLMLGCHIIDQILWILNSPVERVYAEVVFCKDTGTDETTVGTLRFANGVHAELLVSQDVGSGFDYLEVLGSAGRVRSDWWPTNSLYIHSTALPAYKNPTTIIIPGDPAKGMYTAELREFAAAIREDREPAVSGEDGLRTLQVIDAAFESAREGHPVELAGIAEV
jgi:predicted dehydrogenase